MKRGPCRLPTGTSGAAWGRCSGLVCSSCGCVLTCPGQRPRLLASVLLTGLVMLVPTTWPDWAPGCMLLIPLRPSRLWTLLG